MDSPDTTGDDLITEPSQATAVAADLVADTADYLRRLPGQIPAHRAAEHRLAITLAAHLGYLVIALDIEFNGSDNVREHGAELADSAMHRFTHDPYIRHLITECPGHPEKQ